MPNKTESRKRKRACLGAQSRWNVSSTAEFGCQVNEHNEVTCIKVNAATQTYFFHEDSPVTESVTVSPNVGKTCEINIKDIFQSLGLEPLSQEREIVTGNSKQEQIKRELHQIYKENGHEIEKLTNNSFEIIAEGNICTEVEAIKEAIDLNYCEQCRAYSIKYKDISMAKGESKINLRCESCETSIQVSPKKAIHPSNTGRPKSYVPTYIVLSYLLYGQYFKDYEQCLRTVGLPTVSEKEWSHAIEWISRGAENIVLECGPSKETSH